MALLIEMTMNFIIAEQSLTRLPVPASDRCNLFCVRVQNIPDAYTLEINNLVATDNVATTEAVTTNRFRLS